jgi:hypothetical protein
MYSRSYPAPKVTSIPTRVLAHPFVLRSGSRPTDEGVRVDAGNQPRNSTSSIDSDPISLSHRLRPVSLSHFSRTKLHRKSAQSVRHAMTPAVERGRTRTA